VTPLDLEAIRKRAEAATAGPWVAVPEDDDRCDGIYSEAPVADDDESRFKNGDRLAIVITDSGYYPPMMPDAEFIAAARQDIPALLSALEATREAGEKLLTALPADMALWRAMGIDTVPFNMARLHMLAALAIVAPSEAKR
jgi:hypothetical protein